MKTNNDADNNAQVATITGLSKQLRQFNNNKMNYSKLANQTVNAYLPVLTYISLILKLGNFVLIH